MNLKTQGWLLCGMAICLLSVSCTTIEIEPEAQIEATSPEPRDGEWWESRHEEKLAQVRRGNIDLVMIGDSITHGWENDGKEVWDEYYASRKPVNLGYGGDRTEHVIWRLQHGEIDLITPKLAVLMIGTNNTGHRKDDPEKTALGIEHILNEFRTRLPETKILLLAIFPREEHADSRMRKINDGTNKIISKFADNRHVFYLDINHVFLDENGDLPEEIMPDMLHPNANGYKLWAEAMEPAISKLLGEK